MKKRKICVAQDTSAPCLGFHGLHNVFRALPLTRPGMANMRALPGYADALWELTDFILYLCLEKARSITGSSHLVDGGLACGVIQH